MAVSFIQFDDYYSVGNATSIANDTALNTTTGNFLVAIIQAYSSSVNACVVTGITDTAGNTYHKAVGVYRSGLAYGERVEIWYAENITGNASNIVTAAFTGSPGYRQISVAEFSGVKASSSLLDISSQDNSGVTNHSSGNSTSLNAGDLIIGGYNATGSRDITAGSGFSVLSSDLTSIFNFAEYKILGAAGDYDASCTTSSSTTSVMINAIFAVSTSNEFVIQDASSASSADNISLEQASGQFTIADALCASSAENIEITQGAPLIDAFSETDSGFTAGHPFDFGDPVDYTTQIELPPGIYYWRVRVKDTGGYGIWSEIRSFEITADNIFVIQDAFCASSADNIVLEQSGGYFQIADANSSSNAENITIIFQGTFQINNADSNSSADNIVLELSIGYFAIADSTSASSADNITLEQQGAFIIADATSASSADNIILTLASGLFAIADANSLSSADNIVLIGNFIIADASSLSSADNIVLQFNGGSFIIADASSQSSADNIILVFLGTFQINDANSLSSSDNIVLFQASGTFIIDDVICSTTAQNITLQIPSLFSDAQLVEIDRRIIMWINVLGLFIISVLSNPPPIIK